MYCSRCSTERSCVKKLPTLLLIKNVKTIKIPFSIIHFSTIWKSEVFNRKKDYSIFPWLLKWIFTHYLKAKYSATLTNSNYNENNRKVVYSEKSWTGQMVLRVYILLHTRSIISNWNFQIVQMTEWCFTVDKENL